MINGCPHSGPAMTGNEEGVHFAWFTGGNPSGVYYANSTDNGKNFMQRDRVALKARHPQVTALNDGELAIVWDERIQKSEKYFSVIGMENRSAKGNFLFKDFVTSDTLMATYPVVVPLRNSALVAFTLTKFNTTYIAYQSIYFE